MYPVWRAHTLDDHLPYPHYSNPQWNTEQVIFGDDRAPAENRTYSDRLFQWDSKAADHADRVCSTNGIRHGTPRWHQAWLSAYHQRPVTLVFIAAVCHAASGFTIYAYGYNFAEEKKSEQLRR